MKLRHKVALVSAAGSGIGRAIAFLCISASFLGFIAKDSGGGQSMSNEAQLAADLKAIEELHRRDTLRLRSGQAGRAEATKAYDVETPVALWSHDIVALPPGQPPLRGQAANRQMLEAAQGR